MVWYFIFCSPMICWLLECRVSKLLLKIENAVRSTSLLTLVLLYFHLFFLLYLFSLLCFSSFSFLSHIWFPRLRRRACRENVQFHDLLDCATYHSDINKWIKILSAVTIGSIIFPHTWQASQAKKTSVKSNNVPATKAKKLPHYAQQDTLPPSPPSSSLSLSNPNTHHPSK